MKSGRKLRLSAILCAFAMLACELISYPFTTMGVDDDGPYIQMAKVFAKTGHIVYNGWASAMTVAQIYIADAFIKFFGFSYTTVRMSTLLLSAVTAFFIQRTLVRTGSSERNATLGTLTIVLSPVYLMLSATFMSDIIGLLAIVLCLYGCVRALQSNTDRGTIAWLFVGVLANAVFGTSRQIAWLGDLVMLPSTLWLLRSRSRVRLAGAAAYVTSAFFILACVHWLSLQPYVSPTPLFVSHFPKRIALHQLIYILLELPFLVLPIVAVFLPEIRKSRKHVMALLSAAVVAYLAIAIRSRHLGDTIVRLQPTAGDWFGISGGAFFVGGDSLSLPIFLHTPERVLFTLASLGGLAGVIAVALRVRKSLPHTIAPATEELTWRQITTLCLPFSLAYLVLLIAATGTTHVIFDRYGIVLLVPILIVLIRLYQQRVQPNLPVASVLLIIVMSAYGIVYTHNTFAFRRARVALADRLHAAGIPYTSIDGGWDYNLDTELRNADHINLPLIKNPANAYVPVPPPPPGYCEAFWNNRTPHVHPVYGMSLDPNYCYGLAPFAPVQYRPWPSRKPLNIYAVLYVPPGKP